MTALKKVNDAAMRAFTWVTIVFGSFMTCIVFVNVITRYVFHTTIPWAEESARFLFIWVTFLGVVIANDRKEHMQLDFVVNQFPYNVRKVILGLVYLAIVAFLAILIHGSVRYTVNQWDWKSSALHIRHGLVYMIAPISFTMLALQFFARGIGEFMSIGKEEEV